MDAETSRTGRGQGGRPPQPRAVGGPETGGSARGGPGTGGPETAATRVQVAVRIAHSLYEQVTTLLLVGAERPSYGQLVVWACEDHPELVVHHVRAARQTVGMRRPRGRRLAADTVQVTLRLTMSERELLDDMAERVRAAHPGLVTRTDVTVAALRTALERPATY